MRTGNRTGPRITFSQGRDLRRLTVHHHCSVFPVRMRYIGWDDEGRGWVIYACPVCRRRAGFARERGRVVRKFG